MSATDETPEAPRPARNPMMGSTNCSEVLAEVWMFLDRECDPARRAVLEQHLEECAPCLAEYGIDEKLKALLARKCGGDVAPSGLKERLRAQIRSAVLEQAEGHVASGPVGSTVSVRATRVERHG